MSENTSGLDHIEAEVLRVFEQVLDDDMVSAGASLFDLGGTSMDAVVIVSTVAEATGVQVPLEAFLVCPTVQDLARSVRDALAGTK